MELNLLVNARTGDGCITKWKSCTYASLSFSGTNESWLRHKYSLAQSPRSFRVGQQNQMAWGRKTIYSFSTKPSQEYTEFEALPLGDVINSMKLEDLVALHLDDGSLHKRKKFIHLYCNSFSTEETELLAVKVSELLYSRLPTVRFDRKKSGKCYPLLYIGVSSAEALREASKTYCEKNNISDFEYKYL